MTEAQNDSTLDPLEQRVNELAEAPVPTDPHAPGARWAQLRYEDLSTPEGRQGWLKGMRAAEEARQRKLLGLPDEIEEFELNLKKDLSE